jgi:outer membrane protein OmpA-like peptidoglycan-associated protein
MMAPPPLTAPPPLDGVESPQSSVSSASAAPQADDGFGSMAPPKRLSFADAPPPPDFNLPSTNVNDPFAADQFETVVISADGMEEMPAPTGRLNAAVTQGVGQNTSGPRFPEPGVAQGGFIADGNMARVATIHFADNSANIDERDRSILGAVIQLQKERGGHVVVVGHASSRTRDMDYIRHKMVNFEISMKRAATIGNALKSRGLGEDQLEIQAVSDAQPQYLEVMPSGEVGNRRVEIYLTSL